MAIQNFVKRFISKTTKIILREKSDVLEEVKINRCELTQQQLSSSAMHCGKYLKWITQNLCIESNSYRNRYGRKFSSGSVKRQTQYAKRKKVKPRDEG